jgi:hypothetical protein
MQRSVAETIAIASKYSRQCMQLCRTYLPNVQQRAGRPHVRVVFRRLPALRGEWRLSSETAGAAIISLLFVVLGDIRIFVHATQPLI